MDKNLSWKIILILALTGVAAWTLYPPHKSLKRGIDLGGGTSLIYEIDTHGMTSDERRGLSGRMITVLRRRIDPANIQNLVWRPQGNTRFEIQMPLASQEARDKRQAYENTLNDLLVENVTTSAIMRAVAKPAEERAKDFARFAHDSNERLQILNDFVKIYDQRKDLQQQRDDRFNKLSAPENQITLAGLNLDEIKAKAAGWAKLDKDKLKAALIERLGSETNLDLLTQYVELYGAWAEVVEKLTEPDAGLNIKYNNATQTLIKLNLTEDQITSVLEAGDPGSAKQKKAVEALIKEFPERKDKINKVVDAYAAYFDFRGRLDDPGDLQRMLKGAGILEFRILPTEGHAEVDMAQMNTYLETLKTKGPRYAPDEKKDYIWAEIEDPPTWKSNSITGQFGNKFYVLASNKKGEVVLHTGAEKDWRLVRASPSYDDTGRRAIAFQLDERGGKLFSNVTGNNIDRPLCITLDGLAISAPNIQSRIFTRGQITGGQNGFTQTMVEDMVGKLNAGSLPARLIEQPISVRTIGPSIGSDNLKRGIVAGLIGLAGVVLCMLAYYFLAGSIADIALLLNLLFVLAIMAGSGATFTLPGIAGVILTIGMSVDANVLIFERIREEQQKGSSLTIAIKNGYERAFSAIFDSNLTTIMTAAILYWVASEEIKGFAITLMLGLASSMFTALFVTRVIFDLLLKYRLIKDHLFMLQLIRKPNIDWMKYRPAFFVFSGIITIGGLLVFFTRDESKSSKYDIEFTGGTSVQINLKQDVDLTRQQVEDAIHEKGRLLNNSAIASATIYSVGETGRQYEINTTETNRTVATLTLPPGKQLNTDEAVAAIRKAEAKQEKGLGKVLVSPTDPQTFTISTSQLNKQLVVDILKDAFPDANVSDPQLDEVVTNVILSAFEGKLEVRENLQPKIASAEKITDSTIEAHPELTDYLGGALITCELGLPATGTEIEERFGDLRFKPDMRDMPWYSYKLLNNQINALDPNVPFKSFVYISASPEAAVGQPGEDVWMQFIDNETTKVKAAMEIETSLPQVTQIDPSVGKEAQRQALVAIVLSLLAMLVYLAFRFGDLRYGFGGIVTLAHDTCATIGAVSICTYIAATSIGQALGIGDFKFDMTMVAAFLTLLGYSINDSIVIYDRIRENKRKTPLLSPQIINNSINECMSRTLLTGTTTLLVLLVMYIFGGKGLRGFNFAMLFGIIIGTYSSIGISAPILLLHAKAKTGKKT